MHAASFAFDVEELGVKGACCVCSCGADRGCVLDDAAAAACAAAARGELGAVWSLLDRTVRVCTPAGDHPPRGEI